MVMSSAPTISVLLPVYNAAPYVASSVESVLQQTFTDFELLIFDDGSRDESPAIVQRLANSDSRICVFHGPNLGLLEVLKQGVAIARGDFIARMDADDICVPGRFEQQLRFFDEHPECVAVGSRVSLMDPDGDLLGTAPVSMQHQDIDRELLFNLPGKICHPTVMMRSDAVRRVGGYQQEYHYEDVDLFLRLAEVGELANLDSPLLKYRLHPASISHTRKAKRAREIYSRIATAAVVRRGSQLEAGVIQMQPQQCIDDMEDLSEATQQFEAIRYWSSLAFESGYYRTAWKHAWRAMKMHPRSPRSWWTLSRCLAGSGITNATFRTASRIARSFRRTAKS